MIAIQDEEPESVGMGSYREAIELKNIQEITRKHQLSLVFCSPTERVHDTAHFRLEIVEKSIKERVLHIGLRDPKTMKYIGYVILPVPPNSHPVWKEYMSKKDEFITDVLMRRTSRLDFSKICGEIKANTDVLLAKNKAELKTIVQEMYPSFTTEEIKMITNKYFMHNREDFQKAEQGYCPNCGKKGLRKKGDGQKCYLCGVEI